MRTAARSYGEPVGPVAPPTGFDVSKALAAAIALARPLAGERVHAIILAGSHASGEAVWATLQGRTLCLSDLDVYAVLADAREVSAAEARAREGRTRLRTPLAALGFVAPLELGFVTRTGLAHMPARPGVLELRRHGRVLEGDAAVLGQVPAWSAADVSPEEQQLLLENRGFELLLAAPGVARTAPERLLARHATLKTALDLAGVIALEASLWPVGGMARLEWARSGGLDSARSRLPRQEAGATAALDALGPLWDAALAFRANPEALEDEASAREWRRVVQAWCAISGARCGVGARLHDPWPALVRTAGRAAWRRRARQALAFSSRTGYGPGLGARLRHFAAGTPQHRVHGSGAVLLHAASLSGGEPVLPGGALRALSLLGVTHAGDWQSARSEVAQAWDQWLQLGQRTQEPA